MQSRIINIGTATKTNITELPRTIHVPLVSKEQLANGDYTLIDVRTPEEHAAHNIGGTNIPMQLLEENIARLDTTKPIVCYCASGKRSLQAAKWLKGKLPDVDVWSLEGGMRNIIME
jgi:adenylyltransferase/sulfurtransferase